MTALPPISSSSADSCSSPTTWLSPRRHKSSQAATDNNIADEGGISTGVSSSTTNSGGSYHRQSLNHDGDVPSRTQEVICFPKKAPDVTHPPFSSLHDATTTPVLLNAREHAVGYLSKILNARVYDAAVETELQEAKNLSAVRIE